MTAQVWLELAVVLIGGGGLAGLLIRMGRLIQVIEHLREAVAAISPAVLDHEKRIVALEATRGGWPAPASRAGR